MKLLADVVRRWGRTQLHLMAYYGRHMAPGWRAFDRTRRLAGSERARSIFVFGGGPSLRKLDPHKIQRLQREQGFHVAGVNSYVTSAFGAIARPDVYVLSDPATWTG